MRSVSNKARACAGAKTWATLGAGGAAGRAQSSSPMAWMTSQTRR